MAALDGGQLVDRYRVLERVGAGAMGDVFLAVDDGLGRKVAPTIYSAKELSKRVKQDNAFVTRVLAQPKLWLIGDESDLAA